VVVSLIHIAKGDVAGPYRLNSRVAPIITAFLFHAGGDEDPKPLRANSDKSFIGPYVYGMGFTFDDTDNSGLANPVSLMRELIARNPRNAERVFPYIGGEEVNESPAHAHHRWVINFEEMSEEDARIGWPDLLAIIDAKVRPYRLRLKDTGTDKRRKQYWWQFASSARASRLYFKIRSVSFSCKPSITPRIRFLTKGHHCRCAA
jgi:hypothetical protein